VYTRQRSLGVVAAFVGDNIAGGIIGKTRDIGSERRRGNGVRGGDGHSLNALRSGLLGKGLQGPITRSVVGPAPVFTGICPGAYLSSCHAVHCVIREWAQLPITESD
jgi:hypothetical protein